MFTTPSDEENNELHHQQHCHLLRRLALLFGNYCSLSRQFSNEQPPNSWFKIQDGHVTGPDEHLFLGTSFLSILEECPVGSVVHQRSYMSHDCTLPCPDLLPSTKRFFPGTLIVPLENVPNGKPFYVNHPTYGTGYLHHGEMLYVPGNVLRGEIGLEMGSSIHYAPTLYVELNSSFQQNAVVESATETLKLHLVSLVYLDANRELSIQGSLSQER
jgi:hypothetical protein